MNDACKACRERFEWLQEQGHDVELGCEYCFAETADSIQVGAVDSKGHEVLVSIDFGGDGRGVC